MTQIDHWNILSPAKKSSSYTIIKFKRARLDFSKTSYTINQSKNSFKLKRIQKKLIMIIAVIEIKLTLGENSQ